jgi:DNA repair exonuclease SbcCD ATPase subunit
MKKIIGIMLLIPLFMGCNQQKVETLAARNDSLIQQENLKVESINDFLATLNGIQENLNAIKEKENIITKNYDANVEMKKGARERITDDISAIYSLLTDTRAKLDEARNKLGKSSYKLKEFETMVANMTLQIQQKDSSLVALRTQVEAMNTQIASLTRDVGDLEQMNVEKENIIASQVETIDNKDLQLNTAFYALGTKKELKEENIITGAGGFIGIGKAEKLNQGVDEKLFTRIDLRQVSQISLPGKKPEIITTHDASSYNISWETDHNVLNITDKEKFWKSSKYLVVINN